MPVATRRASYVLGVVFAATLGSGCYLAHERSVDAAAAGDAPVVRRSALVWVLVHPSDAPMGPGLFLYDEDRGAVVSRVPLPAGVESPHGLTWDGRSLWLSDVGVPGRPTIYELSPDDGRVLSRIVGHFTEGLASDGDSLWCASAEPVTSLLQLAHDGSLLGSVGVREVVIQDLVFADGALHYVVNDDPDRIMRVDPSGGAPTELARDFHEAPYSLGFDGAHLVVAVDRTLYRFDPRTGAAAGTRPIDVGGWITAIAYVR